MFKIRFNIIIYILLSVSALLNAQQKSVRVISPNGNEGIKSSSQYSIAWISSGIDKISLFYSENGTDKWNLIASNVSADIGTYSWTVPTLNSESVKVRIEEYSNNLNYDESDDFFSIDIAAINKGNQVANNYSSTIRILPLGNSITYDTRKNDTRPTEDRIGYRYPLYNLLNADGLNFSFVGSEHSGSNFFPNDESGGFPGIRTDQLLNLLLTGRRLQPQNSIDQQITPGAYLDYYPADIILIHTGTNNNDHPTEGTSPVYMEGILDEIDRFEDETNTNVVVILARIIDRVPNETYVKTLNDNVVAMALDRVNNPLNDAYPDNIIIVDMEDGANLDYTIDYMGTVGNGIPGDMSDALHCNDKGYVKMAQVWYDALVPILDSPPIISENPKSQSVIEGETIQLSVSASGSYHLSFQWKKDGIDIPEANDSILVIENVGLDYNGVNVSCYISSLGGSIESDSAQIHVTDIDSRVTYNLIQFYRFNEAAGSSIYDNIVEDAVDLSIGIGSNTLWLNPGLQVLDNSSIAHSEFPSKLYNSVKASDEITVEMLIKPELVLQNGPARIITYSKNRLERNFGLFQNNDRYDFRLRTTATDNNGVPSIITDAATVVLEPTHIVYTLASDDTARLYINGNLVKQQYLSGTFSNWDSTYLFGIGNEFVDDKPWLGTFYMAAIYNRALTNSEINHNYEISNNNLFAPSNFQAIQNTNCSIDLSWTDNSISENGFKILRKRTVEANFEILDSVLSDITNYTDSTILEGVQYSYAVIAFNDLGDSEVSNQVEVTTTLPNPTDLAGLANDSGHITLNWVDNSKNEIGYRIERKPAVQDSVFSILKILDANKSNYIDTTSKPFSAYEYRVNAYSSDTVSDFSNVINVSLVDISQDELIEKDFILHQNYPNPFNPVTTISYSIPEKSKVSIVIFNVLGEPVFYTREQIYEKGNYNVVFDAKNLSSGIYFYKLTATSAKDGKIFERLKKLVLLK